MRLPGVPRMYTPCLPKLERVCHPAFRAIPPTVPTNAVVRLQAPSTAVAARRELGVMLVQCVMHASLTTNKDEQQQQSVFFSRRGGSVGASKRDRGVGCRGNGVSFIFSCGLGRTWCFAHHSSLPVPCGVGATGVPRISQSAPSSDANRRTSGRR